MVKQIFEIILAIALSILPLSPTSTPEVSPATVTAANHSQQSEGVIMARFENMLEHNHCFGSDFQNDDALVFSASVTLKQHVSEGKIDANLANAFIFDMYGIELSNDEFYDIVPRGYSVYEYTVTDFAYNGDGTITANANVVVNPDTEAEKMSATATFFVDGTSNFGYNLISCELY